MPIGEDREKALESAMTEVLHSQAKPSSPEFRENREHHLKTIEEIQAHVAQAKLGGGEESCARHRKRGKLLPRLFRACFPVPGYRRPVRQKSDR